MITEHRARFRQGLGLAASAILLLAAAPPPSLIDLTGAYLKVWRDTEGQPPAARVARFKADVAPLFPGFYDARRIGMSQAEYDAMVARSFERFPRYQARYAAAASATAGQLAAAQADFGKAFPDAGAMFSAYLLHSLGEMDGGTRNIGGRSVLIFGVDVMAQVHGEGANERPLFEHELFHVYHEPRLGPCNETWCALWQEGLATYVAAQRNPGATPAELLLVEADLAALTADPTAAVCTIRRVALSEAEDDYKRLFNGGASFAGLPERAGYYTGFLVAGRLGQANDLRTMANWAAPEAKQKVLATLAAMAPDCPS